MKVLLQAGLGGRVPAPPEKRFPITSRTPANRQTGLDAMRAAGAEATAVEMILFELVRDSTPPAFREILKIVR